MKEVTSINNQMIKSLKKLREKKYRDSLSKYLIEGLNLFKEALKTKQDIVAICINSSSKNISSFESMMSEELKARTILIPDEIFRTLSETVNPQDILAVIHKEYHDIKGAKNRFVILDQLQDPGNVGTIIRTAEAAGFDGIIAVKGTADIYSSKVIRAAAGSLFRIGILEAIDSEEVLEYLQRKNVKLYACDGDAKTEYVNADLKQNIGIVIGNEGNGISAPFLKNSNTISIPMKDDTESLNAAVAAGIVIYESVRQNRF